MKILFIKPCVQTINQTIDPPLGILCLSAYLKERFQNKIAIEFIDLRLEKNAPAALTKKLQEAMPDVIGISIMTFEKNFLGQYRDIFSKHAPSAKIIIGGPYASTNGDEALMHDYLDCAVIGEGERVMANLIACYLENKDILKVNGIAYRSGESVIRTDMEQYIDDMDKLPIPDYHLLDLKRYWGYQQQMNIVLAEKKYLPIMSSRACPYRCIYCHNMFGKTVRKRSAEKFFSEIKLLYHEYGVREFHIIDDVFNIDRKRMHEILNKIIESGLKIKIAFPNGLRGDLLEEEDILLLKKAGAYSITLAIETASERMQKLLKKNLNVPKVVSNIAYANKIGLITRGFFMLGFPGESIEEMQQTVNLAFDSKLDFASFSSVVPFKGTELYELSKQYYKNLSIDDFVSYNEKSMYEAATGFNVSKLQKHAYLKFYTFKRIIPLFFKIPRKGYLMIQFLSLGYGVLRALRN
jgi:radical SAM superfamily enzyme YgiQ (UPF0313 family)